MNFSLIKHSLLNTVATGTWGVVNGGLSGAVGSTILTASGYSGYIPEETAKIAAVGAGLLTATTALYSNCCSHPLFPSHQLFSAPINSSATLKDLELVGCGHITTQFLGSLVGWALLSSANLTPVPLGKSLASSTVGIAVLVLPLILLLLFCVKAIDRPTIPSINNRFSI